VKSRVEAAADEADAEGFGRHESEAVESGLKF
jgi:hypothetical protein